jgi:LysR family transcriptional regulator, glycine cleavage system transcriptional activator
MNRMPPLNALRAFEAAARHGSFKRAANELNVTDGSVSRHVALLESWFGVSLFHRLNRQVALTSDGLSLFSEISPALGRIRAVSSKLSRSRQPLLISVNAPPTFTMHWLIPRLTEFFRKHPTIDINLTTSIKPVDFITADYDVAIRRSPPGEQINCEAREILAELRTPVCSPKLSLLKRQERPDLRGQTLVHTATSPSAWADWLSTHGQMGLTPGSALHFEEMYFSVQAAINGLGFAIVPATIVIDDVLAGRLTFPFGVFDPRENHYHAMFRPGGTKRAAIETFCNWLQAEGEKTRQAIETIRKEAPRPQPLLPSNVSVLRTKSRK